MIPYTQLSMFNAVWKPLLAVFVVLLLLKIIKISW